MAPASPFAIKLATVATKEFDDFHEFNENSQPLRSRIDVYCSAAGVPRPQEISEFPWSAVFISWCVKTAGATAEEFEFSETNAVFVKAAIANADANVGVFRARSISSYRPKIGDLIHRNRAGGKISYAQARSRSDYPSHSAIVVDLITNASGKFAVTIGGNESNSIRRQRVRLTPSGFVLQTKTDPYICVIENQKAEIMTELRDDRPPGSTTDDYVAEGAVCGGSGDEQLLEATPTKPPVRQETTTHKDSRQGQRIDHIVIHYTTSRNINGTISHFKTGTPRTSAHYIVGQDGALVQMVPDADNAWHAGNRVMNKRSIGIEHVAKLGDKITNAQSDTSIALIRFLMHTHGIPFENIIPHVCVKNTDCCGDLFRDFGGGAGFSCEKQLAAVRAWLTANGIGAGVESADAEAATREFAASAIPEATVEQTLAMARAIVNFEARRDAQGRIAIYQLPPGDGGGRYEVAGINERYHKAVCDELVALIQNGRHAEAEQKAAEFIASYTNSAAGWTRNAGIEFYLRDTMFNRGPGGAAWILQKAVGVEIDQHVGRDTLAAVRAAEARPRELLDRLRAARESYERLRRDESSRFWRGLVNRWNKAKQIAITFMPPPDGEAVASAGPALQLQSAMEADDERPIGEAIPFIDDKPASAPSFYDIGRESPIDSPAQMLRGIRAYRNNVEPGVALEIAIGQDTSLPASFLEALSTGRRCVGKISTSGTNYKGGSGSWSGTGFLVGKNILLTNHHVLNSTEVAGRAFVDFTYEVSVEDLASGVTEPKAASARRYRLDPTKLFITSPVGNGGLDYTFVWIEDEAEASFKSIKMARAAFSVAEKERAFIIHHPNGHGRRVSLDENEVKRITTSVVRYSTDTMPGSSGSPVFNRQGRLIALHHASTTDPTQLPDGSTTQFLNEGIKIAAIVADLETRSSGPEGTMARHVLDVVEGSDTMAGFFGSSGRTAGVSDSATSVERVVDVYKGSDNDIDIGFWNIEWLANRYHDPEKLRLAAFLIVDLGLDIWGLEEVSPPAVRALVQELDEQFGEKYEYALSEPDAGEGKQSTAVIWKTKTVEGGREEWPEDVERLWHLRSTDDLGLEAVEGKIFDRYPGLFRFRGKGATGNKFDFYVVPLHLKAMDEGSKRRKLASRLLAHAVKTMIEEHDAAEDWVLGGDFNAELASNDFSELLSADFVPLSAADEDAGQMSYIKSPKSLIDHIFLSPNLAKRTGDDAYFIVAKEKSVDKYAQKLSDHRPVLVRLSLGKSSEPAPTNSQDLDAEIARLLRNGSGPASRPKPSKKR